MRPILLFLTDVVFGIKILIVFFVLSIKKGMSVTRYRRGSKTSKILYPTAKTLAGQRRQVWEGRAETTRGGLRASDLKKSKSGKIVSKAASRAGKLAYQRNSLGQYKAPNITR